MNHLGEDGDFQVASPGSSGTCPVRSAVSRVEASTVCLVQTQLPTLPGTEGKGGQGGKEERRVRSLPSSASPLHYVIVVPVVLHNITDLINHQTQRLPSPLFSFSAIRPTRKSANTAFSKHSSLFVSPRRDNHSQTHEASLWPRRPLSFRLGYDRVTPQILFSRSTSNTWASTSDRGVTQTPGSTTYRYRA